MDARRIDEVAAEAVPATEVDDIDGWRCRANPDVPFRRANAALPPVGAADMPGLSDTVARVADWYHDRGHPARVQVSTADPTWQALDDRLAAAGFVVEAPVTVLVAPAERTLHQTMIRTGSSMDTLRAHSLRGCTGVDEAWASSVAALHGDDAAARARTVAYGRMLEAFGPDGLGVVHDGDSGPSAVGFAVRSGELAGIFGMATASAARRRGAGRAVLGTLASLALGQGATELYLQLEDGNEPAAALYGGVGFTPSHRYHYRTLHRP
jgi:GNAT superfamily N-acetyltransferase